MQSKYYLLETSYIKDSTVKLSRMFHILVTTLAPLVRFYEVKLPISPKNKKGVVPKNRNIDFLGKLAIYLFENSKASAFPEMRLYRNKISSGEPAILDTLAGWHELNINLTASEFSDLQKAFIKAELPSDLFFLADETVCVKATGILGWFGVQKCYTPREYRRLKH